MIQRSERLANQLVSELTARIWAGDLVDEDGRLPSEGELSQQYEVSRATVREALTKLELAGIVIRRQGVGTFVSDIVRDEPDLIRGWLDEAASFLELIRHSGRSAAAKVLYVTETPAGGISKYLNVEPDHLVIALEKLYLADETPVIYSWTVIPREVLLRADDGDLETLNFRQSTYQLLQTQGNHKVNHQRSEVKAIAADQRVATLLHVDFGAPLLQLEEIAYGRDQVPLFYALHHMRGDKVSFRQVRIPSIAFSTWKRDAS